MRKMALLGAAVALLVALALPGVAGGAAVKPTFADRFEARKTCIGERGYADPVKRWEFRQLYGRHPMRRCVRYHARLIAMERRAELPVIRAECRLARMEAPIEFQQEYPGGIRMCVRMESMP
jgi:hypothetical protein